MRWLGMFFSCRFMPCKICCSHTTSRKNSPLTESKVPIASGAGTNLKVGGGGTDPAQSTKNFLVVPLHFLALRVQLVVFVNASVMTSTVWSVICLLFFYSRFPPPFPAICKSGGARAPRSRRHCALPSLGNLPPGLGTNAVTLTLYVDTTSSRWRSLFSHCVGVDGMSSFS